MAHPRLGSALGSGFALVWAKGRTRGIAPITSKCLRRGEAPPHIGAAKPQIIAPTETGVFAQRSAACRMARPAWSL